MAPGCWRSGQEATGFGRPGHGHDFEIRRRWLPVVVLLLCSTPLSAQTPALHRVVAVLTQLKWQPGPPDMSEAVPAADRPLLVELKHGLRQLAGDELNLAGASAEPDVAQRRIAGALLQAGVPIRGGNENPIFGAIQGVTVQQPKGRADLRIVKTSISITCGSDQSLYVYQYLPTAGRWTMKLALERNGFAQVDGAAGSLHWLFSPTEPRGWWLVAADTTPWCTSAWRRLRYTVVEPGLKPDQPRILLHRSTGIYIGNDNDGNLKLTHRSVQIEWEAAQSLDPGILLRTHIARYRRVGDQMIRVAPLALRPEDFVDTWLELPWNEAVRWAEVEHTSSLHRWHLLFQVGRKGYTTTLSQVQPSPGAQHRWQVGVRMKAVGQAPQTLPAELFFTVVHSGGRDWMESVHAIRPPGCPGNTPVHGASDAVP